MAASEWTVVTVHCTLYLYAANLTKAPLAMICNDSSDVRAAAVY